MQLLFSMDRSAAVYQKGSARAAHQKQVQFVCEIHTMDPMQVRGGALAPVIAWFMFVLRVLQPVQIETALKLSA